MIVLIAALAPIDTATEILAGASATAMATPPASALIRERSVACRSRSPVVVSTWLPFLMLDSISSEIKLIVAAPAPAIATATPEPLIAAAPAPPIAQAVIVDSSSEMIDTSPIALTLEASMLARAVLVIVLRAAAAPNDAETAVPADVNERDRANPPASPVMSASFNELSATPPLVVVTSLPLLILASVLRLIVFKVAAPAPATATPAPALLKPTASAPPNANAVIVDSS